MNSNDNYYQLTFKNIGGIVTPLVIEFEFDDGEKRIERIQAEILRYNANTVSKIFVYDKTVKGAVLDPHQELVDADYDNNSLYCPTTFEKIEITTQRKSPPNPMQTKKNAEELKKKENEKVEEESNQASE